MPHLTAEQMQRLIDDVSLGRPLSIQTAEALAFAASVRRDLERVRAQGGYLDYTPEIPGLPERTRQ